MITRLVLAHQIEDNINNDILLSCLAFQVMPLARNQRKPHTESQSYCLHSYIMGHVHPHVVIYFLH